MDEEELVIGRYPSQSTPGKLRRSSTVPRNPIKVVVDMMGEDGLIHQKIINQEQPNFTHRIKINRQPTERKVPKVAIVKQATPVGVRVQQSTTPGNLPRSFVFNRFHYDNYRQFPVPRTRNSMPSKRGIGGSSGSRNLEVVFCENKLPEFMRKTNQHIEAIYQQEQQQMHHHRQTAINQAKAHHSHNLPVHRPQRTTLASCLKEFATLQKLSLFMEGDQERRQKCLCYEAETDPSRTLLLDIITHRFRFLKTMSRGPREAIYRSILCRPVNALTKINIQEYMKLSSLFVGRDAPDHEVAAFMYILLFGEKMPSLLAATQRLEQINGHLHKLRAIQEELLSLLETDTLELLVDSLAKQPKLLRLFIDYLTDRD